MSYRRLTTKPLNLSLNVLLKRSAHIGLGIGAFAPVLALANPTGGQVVSGTATITTPSSNGMVIKQSTASAIIDWQQFNIGTGQYVQFLQPSSSSVVLNRVIGGGSSSILGSLTGNGQIFLVNTNGVYFGKGASVDAQGFLASTLDINDSDFLSGHYLFNKSGSDAQIVNQGNITAHKGGYVVLAGDYAENDGIIAAQSGHIVLASGTKSTLTLNGNSFVSYAVSQATLSQLAGVKNAGDLEANGGTVIMTADVANLLKATVVNNTGLIEAHGISKQGGVIQLTATGGNIQNAGMLDASATTLGQQGGDITLKTDGKTTLTSKSRIIDTGDGANGGNLEVSGSTISVRGTALLGKGGHMLLDPGTVQIVDNSASSNVNSPSAGTIGHIGVNFIQKQLNQGDDVTIQATNAIAASGNVHSIKATGTGNLALDVDHGYGHVELFGVDINIAGKLTASMGYASFGHLTAGSIDLEAGGSVNLAGAIKNSKGKITTQSAVATTGGLNIAAVNISSENELGSGGLVLSAKHVLNLDANTRISGNLSLTAETIDVTHAISAGNVTAVASNGYANFQSIKATGAVSVTATTTNTGSHITAGNISAAGLTLTDNGGGISIGAVNDSGGDVTLKATGGNVKTQDLNGKNISVSATHGGISMGYAEASGVLTLAASAEAAVNVNANLLAGAKGVSITGNQLNHIGPGGLAIGANSGNISIGARIGFDSGEGFNGNLLIDAYGGAIKLGHGVFVDGNLDIIGKSLAYTGTGDFTLQAQGSSAGAHLQLDASIGTSKAPVKYNVDINDVGGAVFVHASIFTADSINVNQTFASPGGTLQGVLFQGSFDAPIAVSAGKNITVNAANIGVGNARGSSGEVGAVSLIAGKSISLTAVGSGPSVGNIGIRAGRVDIENAAGRNASMLLQAGGSIDLHARNVSIQGGSADAEASGSKGKRTASAVADVTLKAGADVDISGASVNIVGGFAQAEASGANGTTLTATADASVHINAGKAIGITVTHGLNISNGYGAAAIPDPRQKQVINLSVTSGVTLQAGTNVTLGTHSGTTAAGIHMGSANRPSASGGALLVGAASGSKTTVAIHKDIGITAGGSISVSGRRVVLSAGYGVGSGPFAPHDVFAGEGPGATVKFTDTANLNLTAKNIHLGDSDISIDGRTVARGLSIEAESGGNITADLEAAVNIKASAALTMSASDLRVHAGNVAGADMQAHASSHGYGATKAAVTVNNGVNLSAGTLTIGASSAELGAGASAGLNANVGAGGKKASASLTINSGLAINATGALKISANNSIDLFGGFRAGANDGVSASGGKAALTIQATTAIKAASVLLHNTQGGEQEISGGRAVGASDGVFASAGGSASRTVDASVSITTAGALTMTGADKILIVADSSTGSHAFIENSGGLKATATLSNGVNLSAKSMTLSANNSIELFAGRGDALSAGVIADGGAATLNLNSGVTLTAAQGIAMTVTGAGGSSATNRRLILAGGSSGVRGASINANHGGTATVSENAGITLNAGTTVALKNTGLGASGTTGSSGHSAVHGVFVFAGSRFGDVGSRPTIVEAGLGGGTATLNGNVNVNVTAKGAFSMDAGSGQAVITGGSSVGAHMVVEATVNGKATTNIIADVSLTAASAKIHGGSDVLAAGGFLDGALGLVSGSHGGIATVNAESALKVSTTGAFTVSGDIIAITSGRGSPSAGIGTGSAGFGEQVRAHAAAQAALNINSLVAIKAGSVALTATDGFVHIFAASSEGAGVDVDAAGKGDKANVNVNGSVAITATAGSISVIAEGTPHHSGSDLGRIGIDAGRDAGSAAQVQANAAGATAGLNINASVSLTAKKAVTLTASGSGSLDGGSRLGSHAFAGANGKAASATATDTAQVNITGATISFNTKDGHLDVDGGGGGSLFVGASHSGNAALTADGTVNLKASGNLSLIASHGSLFVAGKLGAPSVSISASNNATAAYTALSGVGIQAGGALTMEAIGSNLLLVATEGQTGILNAQNGGAVTYTQTGGITLKAGGNLTLAAGGSVIVNGGAFDRVLGNAFVHSGGTGGSSHIGSPSQAGGKLTANVSNTISVTAGKDVDISAGSGIFVGAGANNQLFVGAARINGGFNGDHWAGGSANLALNTSVTVTAGHDINVIAGGNGSGSLQVVGMGNASSGVNQANVNGGSGSAVAKLSLIGNALFTAKNDIKLDVAGDASILGGSLGNLRADHARGNVTILGSADATLNAGHDVVLDNITGSLTVAGVHVNSSHLGDVLADAHADSGFASITAHEDGGIKAGHDIRTVTAIGGGLNVVGGNFVDAVTLGSANSEHATATASGSLVSGNNVTITTTGDLSVLGGEAGSAAIAAASSVSGVRVATATARGDIIAKAQVTLNIGGVATLAGGESGAAKTSLIGAEFITGTATLDTGVSIKGSGIALNVTGNLLVHGGTGNKVNAFGIGAATKATATASADAVIAATGNVAINAGSASFVGGSVGHASVQAFGSDNDAIGTVHSDVSVTAGKAISVTATGSIIMAGAPGDENSALVLAGIPGGILGPSGSGATSASALATVTGAVKFTAGTTLSVTAGSSLIVEGGSRGGSFAIVAAGSSHSRNDKSALNVDTSVNLTAKGALTLTNTGGNLSFITSPAGSTHARVFAGSSGQNVSATAHVNQSVTVSGKTLTLNGTLSKFSGSSVNSGNVVIDTSINLLQNGKPLAGFHPQVMRTDVIHVAPQETGTSFGGVQSLMGGTLIAPASQPAGAIDTSGISLDAPVASSLGTLQLQGLVLNLVTVLGESGAPAVKQGTSYTPSTAGYDSAFPASCTALVLDHADKRCSAGGK